MNKEVPVARIHFRDTNTSQVLYGTQREADAANLNEGDCVEFKGEAKIVDYVWFYESPIIKFKDGTSLTSEFDDFKVLWKKDS